MFRFYLHLLRVWVELVNRSMGRLNASDFYKGQQQTRVYQKHQLAFPQAALVDRSPSVLCLPWTVLQSDLYPLLLSRKWDLLAVLSDLSL